MTLQKNDFIEIEFTGKTRDGEVFDSNIKAELEKLNSKIEAKPLVLSIGHNMFLKGVEDFLIGKEGKDFEIHLSSENAFGKRESSLIQRMPSNIFKEQKLNPYPGAVLNFDGRMGKILAVSGGRVMVDLNNPLAGKDVIYKIKVLRKVTDKKEQADAFIDFLFKKKLSFKINEKKIIVEVEKQMSKFVELFKDKFKEILGLELEVREIEAEKEEKK
ncbi:peptidylprolyl isomerase [Candidatus Pacearchaeota archaeon]|nr:peptidylprolyl isomerase [Candidatus Pacearchaeota archaeon]